MKKNHISHSDFKNFPKGLIDWSELENKRKICNEDGISYEDFPPISWSTIGWATFIIINGLFLVFVGLRIIFNF